MQKNREAVSATHFRENLRRLVLKAFVNKKDCRIWADENEMGGTSLFFERTCKDGVIELDEFDYYTGLFRSTVKDFAGTKSSEVKKELEGKWSDWNSLRYIEDEKYFKDDGTTPNF